MAEAAPPTASYADVNGVHMYVETSGAGDPLVLLHGGFGGVHLFGAQVAAFAEQYRVMVPEQRGRGHTPDAPGPITYQLLADDMMAFLERSVGTPVHFVGVSDGGVVGILIALQRPGLLRKLVTVGANFHRDGLIETTMWLDAGPDDPAWDGPRQRYAAVSPDGPDHFPVVFGKLQEMWRDGQPTLAVAELARIELPVLVVAGDDDVIDHAHSVAFFEALPRGSLRSSPEPRTVSSWRSRRSSTGSSSTSWQRRVSPPRCSRSDGRSRRRADSRGAGSPAKRRGQVGGHEDREDAHAAGAMAPSAGQAIEAGARSGARRCHQLVSR